MSQASEGMERRPSPRLEQWVYRSELIGRSWRNLPAPLRYSVGAIVILPVLLIYGGALGHALPPPIGWLF